jgi:hypothetical protein
MSLGGSYAGGPVQPGAMLASESDREATQAVLKKAFEDQRLTQDEFESRVGSALAARTQGELAALTRDLPVPGLPVTGVGVLATGVHRRRWVLIAAIAGVIMIPVALIALAGVSVTSGPSSQAAAPVPVGQQPQPVSPGPARCPVGTAKTAVSIANALARDPVYTEPGSTVPAAQARRLRAKINRVDPGRIRIAAVTPSTVRRGGGERTLANAIASCPATTSGVTVVTTTSSTYLVTSYPGDQTASQAAGAALNTHTSLTAGLLDAAGRLAAVDPGDS